MLRDSECSHYKTDRGNKKLLSVLADTVYIVRYIETKNNGDEITNAESDLVSIKGMMQELADAAVVQEQGTYRYRSNISSDIADLSLKEYVKSLYETSQDFGTRSHAYEERIVWTGKGNGYYVALLMYSNKYTKY